jgi:hypothetical protein
VNDPWTGPASTPDEPTRTLPHGLGDRDGKIAHDDAPELPDAPKETRMQRRVRRQAELAGLLGRQPGETPEQYKARILPLMEAALAKPRADADDMRAQAEKAAGVTAEQHKQLDAAFDQVYDDAIDYANGAISDGELSPYQRNVAGMLDFAGGLGGILNNANGRISGILSPAQISSMSASGFEWAEYLGVSAPWERLDAPPPPPSGNGGGS